MSLSRPSRFELRDDPKAFRVLGFLVGDWQFNSRSRAVILLRSWSFSNSMSWNFSSEDGCGSSQTAKRLSGFGHRKGIEDGYSYSENLERAIQSSYPSAHRYARPFLVSMNPATNKTDTPT